MGQTHRFVLGKHSGAAAAHEAYERLGMDLSPLQAQAILAQVRSFAIRAKATPEEADLLRFYGAVGTVSDAAE